MQMTSALHVSSETTFTPREYQERSIQEGLRFFESKGGQNEIHVLPTGAGKSICIAGIADRFDEPVLVLQPSQEILKQNYAKYISYGGHAGVYSASLGRKDLGHVTFASIQSVMSKVKGKYVSAHKFTNYRYIIIDECHWSVNAKAGQYVDFLAMLHKPMVLGFTATPFRMYPYFDTSMLKMITRTRPRIFGKLAYYVQIKELADQGFLCPTKYYSLTKDFDRKQLKVNSTGADYDEQSLRRYYDTINFKEDIMEVIDRVNAKGRRVLAFVNFVEDAQYISRMLGSGSATVHGKTPKKERAQIEADFKSGKLMSVVNVGCWQVGFDDEELDCVIIAKPMRSLAMYYQSFGRALRPSKKRKDKESWLIDLCGNMNVFGRVEELRVEMDKIGLPCITGTGGRLLTGVPLSEQETPMDKFGQRL
jgi:DNA repair protein RadD